MLCGCETRRLPADEDLGVFWLRLREILSRVLGFRVPVALGLGCRRLLPDLSVFQGLTPASQTIGDLLPAKGWVRLGVLLDRV